ncbi:MAG: LLM class F420-dependent oxidoreductase, partial [Candidatus Rokuibacteriota bacterium]
MKIGVVFPQTEIGNDPAAIKAYAEAVENMGFAHILVFDHVLGANPERPGGWKGPYTYRHGFHEPFVLFGFLAAATRRVELVTGIVILPQRQTALVAKQAAAVDVLSGGRLRLGVAVGWNPVEFEALGENFSTRGKRIEEQIEVMRALWTRELVTFEGKHHRIPDAGINPLPVQRPIPVWMGGESEVVQRRMARIADGWMPHFRPGAPAQVVVDRIHGLVRDAGRDPKTFGIEGRIALSQIPQADWSKE